MGLRISYVAPPQAYSSYAGGFCRPAAKVCREATKPNFASVVQMSSIQSDDSTADELAVTASFDSLPEEVARIVLGHLAPREMQVKTCRGEARRGETWWELFRRWDFPGAKYLDTSVKHPRAQWWGCNVAKPEALPRIQRITRLLEENPFNNTN